MKKFFWPSLFVFIVTSVLTLSTGFKSLAATCGDSGTVGGCGTAGGCSSSPCLKCNQMTDMSGVTTYSCMSPIPANACDEEPGCSTTPPATCGAGSTVNDCGPSAGCGCGQMCYKDTTNSTYYCSDNSSCDNDPVDNCFYTPDPIINSPTGPTDFNYSGLKFANLEAVIAPVAKILFYAALVVGVLLIIYSGYILMTSEGNPQRVQQGQEQLTAAILGIMFILLSAAILRVIINSIILGL